MKAIKSGRGYGKKTCNFVCRFIGDPDMTVEVLNATLYFSLIFHTILKISTSFFFLTRNSDFLYQYFDCLLSHNLPSTSFWPYIFKFRLFSKVPFLLIASEQISRIRRIIRRMKRKLIILLSGTTTNRVRSTLQGTWLKNENWAVMSSKLVWKLAKLVLDEIKQNVTLACGDSNELEKNARTRLGAREREDS